MTKQEFFEMRDKQRQAGELVDYRPEHYENDLSESEEATALKALGNQKSGKTLGFTGLLTVETYVGQTVNKVDEIDNVTIWRI